MTTNQIIQHRKLKNNVVSAYTAWQQNTDKSKNEKLFNTWITACEKCEAFEHKHF